MTAIQELIQELQVVEERGETIVNYNLYFDEFLQKEKEQIKHAFENGRYNAIFNNKSINGEEYYEKEFFNK